MNAVDDIDLTGKVVIVSAGEYEGIDGAEENRRFLCKSGSGCDPSEMGTSIFGTWLNDNADGKIQRSDVEKLVRATSSAESATKAVMTTTSTDVTQTPVLIGTDEIHPAALLFPELEADDFERLKESIREHGIRVPVVFSYDRRLLDGRNRLRAYLALGLPRARLPWTGLAPNVDPYAYAWDLNAERRHLTPAQRAAIKIRCLEDSGELARLREDAKARQEKKDSASGEAESATVGKVTEHIAKAADVGKATVERVLRLQREDPEAFAELAARKTRTVGKAKPAAAGPSTTTWTVDTIEALAREHLSAEERAGVAERLRGDGGEGEPEAAGTSCTKENVAKLIRDRYVQTLAKVIVQRWPPRDLKRLVAAIEKLCPSADRGQA